MWKRLKLLLATRVPYLQSISPKKMSSSEPPSHKYAPPVNRSMTELDRAFFTRSIPIVSVYFPHPKHIGIFLKNCRRDILNLSNISPIVELNSQAAKNGDEVLKKAVLMNDIIEKPEDLEKHISPETSKALKDFGAIIEPYALTLDYKFWRSDEILRAILPNDFHDEIPSGFTAVGHVAHVNLKNEYKPYGRLIGQVILDKNPKIRTVVDKVDSIATKFRTFPMEILAGDDDLIVEQKESNCRFQFDFSKVYWNSRLHTEHDRLISGFNSNEVVGDVFAGVGPFAVPAGKKDVIVLANDLNPESYSSLINNIKLNHAERFVKPYNLDGREFIRRSPELLIKWSEEQKVIEKPAKRRKRTESSIQSNVNSDRVTIEIPKFYSEYVMNLPDSALTFLDEFIGLYSDPEVSKVVKSLPDFKLPVINVHCFEKFDPNEPEPTMEDLHRRVHKKIVDLIQFEEPFENFKFHLVRKVAPTKPMFCVTFTLPEQVAFSQGKQN